MKTLRTLLVIAIATFGFATTSFGQLSATVSNAQTTATVFTPITLTNSTTLKFGTFVSDAVDEKTVIIDANDTRGGTATAYDLGQTPVSSAIFKVTGTPNATFNFTLPATTTELGGPSGSKLSIASSSWVTNLASGTSVGTLSASGSLDVKVGATLTVPKSSPAGNYSGTYSISVNYN